jgi:hypothetical protein
MITLSTVIPVIGSLYVATHWLVSACYVTRKTKAYWRIGEELDKELEKKTFDTESAKQTWQREEFGKRLEREGIKGKLSLGDLDIAIMLKSFPVPKAQQVDQWILIVTSVIGVILMGFNL